MMVKPNHYISIPPGQEPQKYQVKREKEQYKGKKED